MKTEAKTEAKHKGSENLIPFKKGESGNLNGRPKGQRNYATIYREAIERIGKAKNMTAEEVENELHEAGIVRAMAGNDKFYKEVMDRLHGKPKQAVEMSGVDGEPIEHTLTIKFE